MCVSNPPTKSRPGLGLGLGLGLVHSGGLTRKPRHVLDVVQLLGQSTSCTN